VTARKLRVAQTEEDSTQSGPSLWQTADVGSAQKPNWLLPNRILSNGLCILEGDPSSGKSVFLAHLAAAVTTGKKWWDRPKQQPADVLWLTGEEDALTHVRPRLAAAKADMRRVHWPARDADGQTKPFYFPQHTHLLQDAITQLGLSLIIIEPLVSFVAPELSLSAEGPARSVVDPLNRLAIATGCCVIVTRGLRKDRTGPRLTHGSGHGTIGHTARSVILIERPDPDRERRVLRSVKYGMCSVRPSAVEYTLEARDGAPVMVGLRNLEGQTDDGAADLDGGDREVRTAARELLRNLLATEYVPSKIVLAIAHDSLIGERTLRKAKADLQVHDRWNKTGPTLFHEWGPPLSGWDAIPVPPVQPSATLPKPRKSRGKNAAEKAAT
jgi:putative DNA primase/helicase